ncbi:MAG: hypothetical protein ACRENV_06690 [Candidatus Dormibacteria bacterium]
MRLRPGLGVLVGLATLAVAVLALGGAPHRGQPRARVTPTPQRQTGGAPSPQSPGTTPAPRSAPAGSGPRRAARPTPTRTPTPAPTSVSGGGTPPPPGPASLTLPLRAAFFYPWYPESWYPTSHFTPTLGAPYNSSSPAVIANQLAAMQYAGINVAIASWWGQGTPTDGRVPLLLSASVGSRLRWALYYEPAPGTQSSDLSYIYDHYGDNPEYARVGGRPVLFVYSRSVASCADATNWVSLNAGRFYLDLQVFGGYQACAVQPDEWHQYAPAEREDNQRGHSFSISPGFFLYNETTSRLARDPAAFTQAVHDMVASGEPWQLITTWNEWGEGTGVEDADQWESADAYGQYVDILHDDG